MSTFLELASSGRTFLVEVEEDASPSGASVGSITTAIHEKVQEIADGAATRALATISELGGAVATICGDLIEQFAAMEPHRRPKQVEMEFALNLTAEASVKIVTAGTDSTFQIKMVWSA